MQLNSARKQIVVSVGMALSITLQMAVPALAADAIVSDDALPLRGLQTDAVPTPAAATEPVALTEPVASTAADSASTASSAPVPSGGLAVNGEQRVIDNLTKKILLTIIELERFNLHYQQNVAKQGRWKGPRYALFGEANGALSLAGGIIGTHERGENLRSPTMVNSHVQERANIIPMIGSIIGAGGAGMEFGINALHEVEARHKGFSPRASRAKVQSLKADIDRMLAQRDALVAAETCVPGLENCVEIDRVEGRILRDLRDQSLLEFARFHTSARKLLAFQQTQYLFDIGKNVTNAVGCNFAYQSLYQRKRIFNMKAGVMFTISGALTMAGPILSRGVSAGVGKMERRFLRTTVEDAESREVAILQQDKEALDKLCAPGVVPQEFATNAIVRGEIYGAHSKVFQDELAASEKKKNDAKLIATQNIGSGLYVGGSKVASGVLFTVVGTSYRTKSLRSTTITNSDLFVSSVIGLPATAYSMLDTLRIQVKGELNRRKQKKDGRLPAQLVAARLKQLDEMEQRLKVSM